MDAPQPENLLCELLDVVERVSDLSTSLLSDTHQALAGIKSQTTEFVSTKFTPVDHDPGCRKRILTDEDRMYIIQQGPCQPRLKSYPSKCQDCSIKAVPFFFGMVQFLSTSRVFYYERCCILFCLSGIFIRDRKSQG